MKHQGHGIFKLHLLQMSVRPRQERMYRRRKNFELVRSTKRMLNRKDCGSNFIFLPYAWVLPDLAESGKLKVAWLGGDAFFSLSFSHGHTSPPIVFRILVAVRVAGWLNHRVGYIAFRSWLPLLPTSTRLSCAPLCLVVCLHSLNGLPRALN